MRHLLVCCCLILTVGIQALETPLILRPTDGGTNKTLVINPGLGTMQYYRSSVTELEQVASANFLADLDYISKVPVPGRIEWSLLRTGSTTCLPSYGQMMDEILPAMSRKRGRGDDTPTLAERAMNSEEAFWEDQPEFDGLVQGAMLENSFVLVMPSTYTILFYSIENDRIDLAGWRNYRTDLYIPQVYQSKPLPQEILTRLPDDVQAARRESIEAQMEEMGEDAGQTISLKPSKTWIGATQSGGEYYVLVDSANRMAMTYEFRSRGRTRVLTLKSARNLEIDLLVPTVYNSVPSNHDLVRRYNKLLERDDQPPVFPEQIEALANQAAVSNDQISPFQALIDAEGIVYLDFHPERQLMTYRLSAQGLDLISARDYTMEAGIGIHAQELALLRRAAGMEDTIEGAVRDKQYDAALRLAGIALEWNPWLYEDFSDNRSIGRRMEKARPEEWLKLIDTAIDAAAQREEEAKRIREAAAAARKAKEERRGR